ncbi:MAG: hypothetical protein K0S47_3063 [Herbinix sp.]|nr:hypothetical protein [Herbinix sp.]
MVHITLKHARQFILSKQGLLGEYRYTGKAGVLNFVEQVGCIQYDPIDVCGKNSELVLQSRVKGFTKSMLYELLYEDRKLIDYYDKNLAIIRVEDWPYFERIRNRFRISGRGQDEIKKVEDEILQLIEKTGPVCSKDIGYDQVVDWYWSDTKLSRAALETLYFRGDLIIHHKTGAKKYYALAKDFISEDLLQQEDPCVEELNHLIWRVLRRISAVGLIWNKPSDAWLFIQGLKSEQRNQVFSKLLEEEIITKVKVEGCKDIFYMLKNDMDLLEQVIHTEQMKDRTELIAPLDNMIWDRKLIKLFFDFDYKWEIYTPADQRKYGYYVLPILSGDRFIGRTEVITDKKNDILNIKHIWLEEGCKPTKKLNRDLKACFIRFMKFHQLHQHNFEEIV